MKIGFIGLGNMGAPLARLIARAGYDLSVFDAWPASAEKFRGIATLAASSAEAAEGASIVCVCVRDDHQVDEVLFGQDGAAERLASGTLLLIHSTVRIDTLHAIERRLAPRGIALVDAPVSRTQPTDDDPFVFTMLGGDPAQRVRALEIAGAYSTGIAEIGPLGAAMALKISNNLVSWAHIVVGRLASRLAAHHGVPLAQLEAVMRANGNLTPTVGGLLTGFDRNAPGANADYEAFVESQAGIGEKDVALAIECVAGAGLDATVLTAVRAQIRDTMVRKRA